MEFVVLILVLTLRALLGLMPGQKMDRWFYALKARAIALFRNRPPHLYDAEITKDIPPQEKKPRQWFAGTGAFFAAVVIPVAALSLAMSVLEEIFWGIPAFLVSILVLTYSLGRKESAHWLTRFQIAWRQKDIQGAFQYASELLPDEPVDNEKQLYQRIFSRLLNCHFQDFFLITFWFMVLGAEGALLARLMLLFCEPVAQSLPAQDAPQSTGMKKINNLRYLFEWLPVKLMGLSFMLTGHFVYCSGQWIATLFSRKISHEQVLTRLAVGAMGEKITDGSKEILPDNLDNAGKDEQLQEVESLLRRSSVLWVIAIAAGVVLVEL